MKHIKLLKSLIIVTPVLALASPLIILSNTGCGNPGIGGYSPNGSNWVGRTGGTLKYTVNDNDLTYTITGNDNFTADDAFTIPDFVTVNNKKYSVTTIGGNAFQGSTGVTSVDFGSVTTIGDLAFYQCAQLTGVKLNNVTSIGDRAFLLCPLLRIDIDPENAMYKLVGSHADGFIQNKSDDEGTTITPVCGERGGIACGNITIPAGVDIIGSQSFWGCAGVTSVDVGDAATIAGDAFSECSRITSVELNNVTRIDGGAFRQCPIRAISVGPNNSAFELVGTSTDGFVRKLSDSTTTINPVCGTEGGIACGNIVIPAGVTTIANTTFYGCAELTGVDFGSVTTIGGNTFLGCGKLAQINLGSVTTISDYAFSGCVELTSVNLGGVTSIGDDAFRGCPLEEINVSSENSVYKLVGTSEGGFIRRINDPATTVTPVCGNSGGIACGNAIFPSAVTTISSKAFYGCAGIILGYFRGATTIGDYAFYGCTKFTMIDISHGATSLGSNWCSNCISLSIVALGTYTYTSTDNGWDNVGPATNCILYAHDEAVANAFKTDIIGPASADKWTYQYN